MPQHLKELTELEGADEKEEIQEYIDSLAQSKMIMEQARTQTSENEAQIKVIQMRRNQLQARLALLRVAHEAIDRSVPGDLPTITKDLRLATMESETIPSVFFIVLERLERQQAELVSQLEMQLEERKNFKTLLTDESARQFSEDDAAIVAGQQQRIQMLQTKRQHLEPLITEADMRRRRQGLAPTGLQAMVEEMDAPPLPPPNLSTSMRSRNSSVAHSGAIEIPSTATRRAGPTTQKRTALRTTPVKTISNQRGMDKTFDRTPLKTNYV